jgi:arsenate reductase
MPLTVYQYPKCSTCRKALAWLKAHRIEHVSVDITAQPPSAAVLKKAMQLAGVPLKRLFNTAGESYRAGNWKQRIGSCGDGEALAALAGDGKLIKRPLVVGPDVALIGFDLDAWHRTLTTG